MTEQAWRTEKPTSMGLYRVRPTDSNDGGQVIEVIELGQFKFMGDEEILNIDDHFKNCEFQVVEVSIGSSA
jgi:hypothetical protein